MAAYDYVETQVDRRDGYSDGSPWWYGWALREAFLAGIAWARQHPPEEVES